MAVWLACSACYAYVFLRGHVFYRDALSMWLLPDEVWRDWMGSSLTVALLQRSWSGGAVLCIVSIALIVGAAVIRFLDVDRRLAGIERLVFAISIGLNLLSTYSLLAGLAGLIRYPPLFLAPPVAAAAWSWWYLRRGGIGGASRPAESRLGSAPVRSAAGGGPLIVIACLTVTFAALIVSSGILPPRAFDVLEYHSQAPKEWYLQGRVSFMAHNVYANMPLGAEMSALPAMALLPGEDSWWWGALAGKLTIALYAPVTALGLYAAGRRFASQLAGVAAAFLYLSNPWVVHVSVNGMNEAVAGHFALAAVLAALIWSAPRDTERRVTTGERDAGATDAIPASTSGIGGRFVEFLRGHGLLIVSGYLAGGAAACKYPMLLFLTFPLSLLVAFASPRAAPRHDAEHRAPTGRLAGAVVFLVFSLSALAGGGAWYGKNLLLSGNPVYPLMYDAFGGATRTPEKDRQWKRAHRVPVDESGSSYGVSQWFGAIRSIGWRSRWQSPLLWPAALLLLLRPRRDWAVILPAILLAWYFGCWWLLTHRIERFWVPALGLASLLGGLGIGWTTKVVWRRLVTVVFCVASLCLLPVALDGVADTRLLLAPLTEIRDRAEVSPVPTAYRYLNRNVTEGSTVLLVGDATPFYLEMPVLYNTCFDDCLFDHIFVGRTRERILAELSARNVSHVYVGWSEIDRYRSPGNYGFNSAISRHLVREDLVKRLGILRKIPLSDVDPERGELFEVVEDL